MLFLKATTTDGKVEYFNAKNILTIQPQGENFKILMGAGLYWTVKADVEMVNLEEVVHHDTQ